MNAPPPMNRLTRRVLPELAPPDFTDPVVEAYKRHVDRSLLREHLKLTVTQRAEKFAEFQRQIVTIRGAALPLRGRA